MPKTGPLMVTGFYLDSCIISSWGDVTAVKKVTLNQSQLLEKVDRIEDF